VQALPFHTTYVQIELCDSMCKDNFCFENIVNSESKGSWNKHKIFKEYLFELF